MADTIIENLHNEAQTEDNPKKFIYPSLREAFRNVCGIDIPATENENYDATEITDKNGNELEISSSVLKDASIRVITLQNNSSPVHSFAIPENNIRPVDRSAALQQDIFIEDMKTGNAVPLSQELPENTLLYLFPYARLREEGYRLDKFFQYVPKESVQEEVKAGRWRPEMAGKKVIIFSDIDTLEDLVATTHEIGHGKDFASRDSTCQETLWWASPKRLEELAEKGITPVHLNNEQVLKERNAWAWTIKFARKLEQNSFTGGGASLSKQFSVLAQVFLGSYDKDRLPPDIKDSVNMDLFGSKLRRERIAEREESPKSEVS